MSPLKITTRDAATGPVPEITGELDHTNAADYVSCASSAPTGSLLSTRTATPPPGPDSSGVPHLRGRSWRGRGEAWRGQSAPRGFPTRLGR